MKMIIKSITWYVLSFLILFSLFLVYNISDGYVAGIVTAAVGFVAYLVYFLGKLNAVQDAAKVLILEIRNAEAAVQEIRTIKTEEAWYRVSWVASSWSGSRHLLVGELNSDDFATLERFFYSWDGLIRARNDFRAYVEQAVLGKSSAAAAEIIKLDRAAADFDIQHKNVRDRVEQDNWLFHPDTITKPAGYFADSFQMISGTTAFARLRKLAGIKE